MNLIPHKRRCQLDKGDTVCLLEQISNFADGIDKPILYINGFQIQSNIVGEAVFGIDSSTRILHHLVSKSRVGNSSGKHFPLDIVEHILAVSIHIGGRVAVLNEFVSIVIPNARTMRQSHNLNQIMERLWRNRV